MRNVSSMTGLRDLLKLRKRLEVIARQQNPGAGDGEIDDLVNEAVGRLDWEWPPDPGQNTHKDRPGSTNGTGSDT
jgi:hypothetical protein